MDFARRQESDTGGADRIYGGSGAASLFGLGSVPRQRASALMFEKSSQRSYASATDLASLAEARRIFHAALLGPVLRVNEVGVPSNADSGIGVSVAMATGVLDRLGVKASGKQRRGRSWANGSSRSRVISSVGHSHPGPPAPRRLDCPADHESKPRSDWTICTGFSH